VRQLEHSHPFLRDPPASPGRTTTTKRSGRATGSRRRRRDLAGGVRRDRPRPVDPPAADGGRRARGSHAGSSHLPSGHQQRIEAEATTDRDSVAVQLHQAAPTPRSFPSPSSATSSAPSTASSSTTPRPTISSRATNTSARRLALHPLLPLLKQGQLIGVLYLENQLASHAFTPARIALLKLLASQAAISLENARLYFQLRQENSERARAEEELRKSEERWRAVFESSALGIAATDLSGRFVAVNPAYRSMLGYSEAELRELSFRMITTKTIASTISTSSPSSSGANAPLSSS